ncbi:GntR family transcriptional regulator [Labrys wisconsinensis]|uniref:DNA-binding GntR family transcriptional regulator n=1 Tax=Labrys wisconsinensis TaxID=425677 RepID=A0ABU0JLR5_9HYPH|nr:GntR family transcriptional regulator [Labrys wisconsinensis]MDQ0475225.1 DNA-binding GntR family transcriptional regulator [Labrys wisconsinensis]
MSTHRSIEISDEAGEDEAWEPAAASIYAQLQEEILDGLLPPGTVISEVMLSRRFGVSRAPLREAVWRLEKRGLLVRPPRQRARVVTVSTSQVEQIFLLREVVEGLAAREAARHITADEIASMRAALRRQAEQSAAGGTGSDLRSEPDNDFHFAIAIASRNEFVIKFLRDDYHALIELCRRRQRRDPHRSARSFVEHSRIVDALEDRDADLAELQMRRHIENARRVLVERAVDLPAPDAGATGARRKSRSIGLADPEDGSRI